MLTPQREAFAAALATGITQAAAYRQAFPRSLNWKDETVWRKASLMAANGEVRARVEELSKKAASANEVTVERVVRELARLAFFDVRKLVNDDGVPLKVTELDDDTARAVAGLDVARIGNADMGIGEVLKFKLADKKGALELLGRHLKMFTDKVEHSGGLTNLPDEALNARIDALTKKLSDANKV